MRLSDPARRIVYGRATSSNVQVVMWALAELGLPCERLDYGHVHGGTDTPAFRAMSPHGLVPVLREDELVIWESSAILRYLGARHGTAPFWPEDPAARAPVDMWAEWAKTTLQPAFNGPVFWARIRPPHEPAPAALDRLDGHLATLEDRIGDGPWLTGSDFTLADILVGPTLYRYHTLEIPRRDRPRLAAYYARLTERPAFPEHVMVSYAPLMEGA